MSVPTLQGIPSLPGACKSVFLTRPHSKLPPPHLPSCLPLWIIPEALYTQLMQKSPIYTRKPVLPRTPPIQIVATKLASSKEEGDILHPTSSCHPHPMSFMMSWDSLPSDPASICPCITDPKLSEEDISWAISATAISSHVHQDCLSDMPTFQIESLSAGLCPGMKVSIPGPRWNPV